MSIFVSMDITKSLFVNLELLNVIICTRRLFPYLPHIEWFAVCCCALWLALQAALIIKWWQSCWNHFRNVHSTTVRIIRRPERPKRSKLLKHQIAHCCEQQCRKSTKLYRHANRWQRRSAVQIDTKDHPTGTRVTVTAHVGKKLLPISIRCAKLHMEPLEVAEELEGKWYAIRMDFEFHRLLELSQITLHCN